MADSYRRDGAKPDSLWETVGLKPKPHQPSLTATVKLIRLSLLRSVAFQRLINRKSAAGDRLIYSKKRAADLKITRRFNKRQLRSGETVEFTGRAVTREDQTICSITDAKPHQ